MLKTYNAQFNIITLQGDKKKVHHCFKATKETMLQTVKDKLRQLKKEGSKFTGLIITQHPQWK